MDIISQGFGSELCYECMEACDASYHAIFSASSYGSSDVTYCYYPHWSKDCFGCVGVKRNRYCVLNKQYSEAEYHALCARIVEHMQSTGEWGEFFPIQVSPLAYNTSIAQDYFPLTRTECEARDYQWHEELQPPLSQPQSETPAVPDHLHQLSSDAAQQLYRCRESGKLFRFTSQELKFYSENKIPLPDLAFSTRHQHRLDRRNPRWLWQRTCSSCDKALESSYSSARAELVYCEKCFLAAVY